MNRKFRIGIHILTIISAVLCIYSVVFDRFGWIFRIPLYVVGALSLFTSCYFLVTNVIIYVNRTIVPKVMENSIVKKASKDDRMRIVIFTIPGVMSNIWFALLNAIMGIMGHSAWFGSLAAYYILLSVMRIQAVGKERYIRKQNFQPKERMKREIYIYRYNSTLFILLAIVLSGMVVLLEYSIGGKSYPGFMIYAVAAFTFYKIIKSTINILKERKKKSPLMMIIRRIGHVDACVSVLTLQTALFAAFGQGQEKLMKIMTGLTGSGVSLLVLLMGIQGIILSKQMKDLYLREEK